MSEVKEVIDRVHQLMADVGQVDYIPCTGPRGAIMLVNAIFLGAEDQLKYTIKVWRNSNMKYEVKFDLNWSNLGPLPIGSRERLIKEVLETMQEIDGNMPDLSKYDHIEVMKAITHKYDRAYQQ